MVTRLAPTLSYCVVNTNGREHLLACLAAIERTHPAGVEREILVLDNASDDGSAEAVRALDGEIRLIALGARTGKAENDSTLMREAGGRYCLLLNEDSELRPGATAALVAALDADPKAAAAGAQLLDSDGNPVPCAWRFPGVGTALAAPSSSTACSRCRAGASETRRVDWAQSSALLVRREAAAEVGYMDPAFFVYYDECDFARRLARRRLAQPLRPRRRGRPPRPALHRPRRGPAPRSSNSTATATSTCEAPRARPPPLRCACSRAWSYGLRALAATVLPNQPAADLLGPRPPGAVPQGEGLASRDGDSRFSPRRGE